MVQTLTQRMTIPEIDEEVIHINFTSMLDTSETIASILAQPADENTTGELTLSTATINAATYDDGTSTVAIGKAIYFSVSGQLASRGAYTITFGVTTSAGDEYSRRLILLVDQSPTASGSTSFFTARKRIADFLGWTRHSGNWSGDDIDRLDEIVNSAYQQFIYPVPLPNETVAHQWSFLKPTYTFDTAASDYLYDMPADFGAMVGDLVYEADEYETRIIKQVTTGMIDKCRAVDSASGRPTMFALRPKAVTMTSSQVTELMLYPTPDAVYGLRCYYDAKVGTLSETNSYMLGGQAHFETILQSCRDVAATRYKDDPAGREHTLFLERLRASVEADRRLSPKTLGFNDDGGRIRHTRHGDEFTVTLTHNLGGG